MGKCDGLMRWEAVANVAPGIRRLCPPLNTGQDFTSIPLDIGPAHIRIDQYTDIGWDWTIEGLAERDSHPMFIRVVGGCRGVCPFSKRTNTPAMHCHHLPEFS